MSQKTISSKRRFGKICVLIVAEDIMARIAWRKILSKSSQIQVVGDITPQEFKRSSKSIPAPEIVVAGFSFVECGLVRSEKIKKRWGSYPKFIIICKNNEEVKAAYKARADWAATGPFSDQELVTWIRALSDDAKRLCNEYLSKLTILEQGSDKEDSFFNLAQESLQLLFHPDLVNPQTMSTLGSSQTVCNRRLIFRNQANRQGSVRGERLPRFNEFWEDTRQNHAAKYVPIDLYNTEIIPVAVSTLGKYLSNLHGSFGIIIGRKLLRTKLYPLVVALFENERKAILMLSDNEIQEMLEYKAGGVNPACVLQDLYQKLIADSER